MLVISIFHISSGNMREYKILTPKGRGIGKVWKSAAVSGRMPTL